MALRPLKKKKKKSGWFLKGYSVTAYETLHQRTQPSTRHHQIKKCTVHECCALVSWGKCWMRKRMETQNEIPTSACRLYASRDRTCRYHRRWLLPWFAWSDSPIQQNKSLLQARNTAANMFVWKQQQSLGHALNKVASVAHAPRWTATRESFAKFMPSPLFQEMKET